MIEKIKALSIDNYTFTQKVRRHIHKYPELSFKEFKTSKFVYDELKAIGVESVEYKAETGVVAMIQCKSPESRVVALRADMDALPIVEQNDVSYKSVNEGVMHACGHDVHTASLLSVAKILNTVKNELSGTIKLIFQPGEERIPGGASLLIKEGVLENPAVNSMIGQHVAPQIPVGKVGFREGMYMASTDELYLKITGKGGHGAAPHLTADPVLATSHIIVALQSLISRVRKPWAPSVLSFGKVIAQGSTNIIPNEVYVEGTFRSMDEEWREEAWTKMKNIAENVAVAMEVECNFEIRKGYPFLKNNPELTRRIRQSATNYVGKENIVDLDLWMGGEDFAFYSQIVDASFYRLGVGNVAKGITSGVHTPTFDIDEKALEFAPGLMAYMAVEELLTD